LLYKAWIDKGRIIYNMPYVHYIHLAKAEHIHETETHPPERLLHKNSGSKDEFLFGASKG
jgi:hypothetical protein